ncbi:pyruvate dehydrogenase kinase-like protein [Planoprotostelium fungivorum]|uniref:Protein-serine/threonine kinase n=1 Tax=Planoprotostelium fungivorum TaxID=1890364 RepID=A0A2P6NPF8_9EUKA|nr:pyruvate dehydrogenase kinase-like protein [Planoprotostelium fungivorum]PRP85835.1 pyruvate dehydrogenase kinase-like protein [Planoprotostelium fungivorum]
MALPKRTYTSKAMLETIYKWAKRPQRGVTLKDLAAISPQRKQQNAAWLHQELPTRLAVQVVKLDKLPYGMCLMPSVRKVRQWYVSSFELLHDFPKIRSEEDEERFTKVLEEIYQRHAPTLILMAKGVRELKAEMSKHYFDNTDEIDLTDMVEIHQFLDSFFMSRIGIRMLIGQHLEIQKEGANVNNHVGLIAKTTSPVDVAHHAIVDARFMCERQHGISPEVEIVGGSKLAFPYVPSHLYYILFELLKNSTRAVVEKHKDKDTLPPVQIIISDQAQGEDVAIKISDEGGGISRSNYEKIWSYLYTTADFDADVSIDGPDFGMETPMAGLGVGLPISRLYARYFGGDLQLMSMEGHGTDAYLHLRKLGDKEEPLSTTVMPQTI